MRGKQSRFFSGGMHKLWLAWNGSEAQAAVRPSLCFSPRTMLFGAAYAVYTLGGWTASSDSPRVGGTPGNGSGSPGKTSGVQALCSFPSSTKNPAHMRSWSQDVSKQIVRQKAHVLCGRACVIMWPPNRKLLVHRNPSYTAFSFSHLPAQI